MESPSGSGSGFDPMNVKELWVMIKSGDGFCWSKLFVFESPPYISGVWNDRYLIVRKPSCKLVLWDPQTDGDGDNCHELVDLAGHLRLGIVSDYVPTLVSVYPDP